MGRGVVGGVSGGDNNDKKGSVEQAALAGKGGEVARVYAEDVLGEACELHAGEKDGYDGLDGGLALDLELFEAGDFFFPEFAAAHTGQVEVLVPNDDLGLDTLHALGDFVECAVAEAHQHEQEHNGDGDRQDAQGAADFAVGQVGQGKY